MIPMTDDRAYLQGLTVLYVEDEEETRNELRKFLSRRARVFTASDGVEAMDMVDDINPDIIIADLIMPRMDGLEMIQQIRQKHPQAKIIITSTVNEMQTVLDTVDIGITKYIIKPIVLSELEESLLKCAGEIRRMKPETRELPPEERRQLETRIKKDLSSVIKKHAGKGPRDIAVFLHGDSVDAIVYDAFTPLEHTLTKKRENLSLVEQCRRSFYSIVSEEICEMMSVAFNTPVIMEPVETNTHNYTDKLCFRREAGGRK